MFPERGPRPTPTSQAWEDEYVTAKHWNRPPRTFLNDRPFYPWCPPALKVKFSLNFQ